MKIFYWFVIHFSCFEQSLYSSISDQSSLSITYNDGERKLLRIHFYHSAKMNEPKSWSFLCKKHGYRYMNIQNNTTIQNFLSSLLISYRSCVFSKKDRSKSIILKTPNSISYYVVKNILLPYHISPTHLSISMWLNCRWLKSPFSQL